MTRRFRRRFLIGILAAALGGWLLDVASPGLDLWGFSYLGFGLILWAIWHQTFWKGLLLGLVAGAAFWLPHLNWLTLYLGPVPWLALSVVMLLWFGLFGALAGYTTRHLARSSFFNQHGGFLIFTQAVAVAGLWVLREQVQSSWPYGGFAWGRAALTQANTPLLESVSWIGIAGLSWVLIFASGLVVASISHAPESRTRTSRTTSGVSILAAVVCILGAAVIPMTSLTGPDEANISRDTLRIAGIQGNAKAGIFDDRESGDVFQSHLDATQRLLDELQSQDDTVDLIVWPENSAEFDVREEPERFRLIAGLARQAQAPIVVGSVLRDVTSDTTEEFYNSSLVIEPDGTLSGRYDKRYPVPFAEYMPNRPFFHTLVPDLVDLVQLDYQPGLRPTVLDIDDVQTGLAICFDITFDRHATELVRSGAEVVLAQTNNADFGQTDESAQQLAITRMQSVSMGRSLVNISTVGTSEILAPNGDTLDAIDSHIPGAVIANVPLVSVVTPAMRIGGWIATGTSGIGVLLFLIATLVDFSTRRVVPREAR
ncbi:MAG: apolipoprotein N-acyltransferase [Canibacter sp.]